MKGSLNALPWNLLKLDTVLFAWVICCKRNARFRTFFSNFVTYQYLQQFQTVIVHLKPTLGGIPNFPSESSIFHEWIDPTVLSSMENARRKSNGVIRLWGRSQNLQDKGKDSATVPKALELFNCIPLSPPSNPTITAPTKVRLGASSGQDLTHFCLETGLCQN